jgi:hypothetical protein
MRRTVQLLAAVLATAIALAGFASMAVAHKTTIGSQHTIDFTPDVASDRFAGQVSSKKAFCERGRSITLYRVVGDSSVPDEKVDTTKTDRSGVWSKGVGNAQAGTYYAKAAKKVVKSRRHKHVCKVAKSAMLPVSPVLEGLSLDPPAISVGEESTGTVSLSVSTDEDLTVSLESSDVNVATVPPGGSVTVSAGQHQAPFTIDGLAAGETEIKATLNGDSATQTLTVNDP